MRDLRKKSRLSLLAERKRDADGNAARFVEEHASEDAVAEEEDVLRHLDEGTKLNPALPGSGPGAERVG